MAIKIPTEVNSEMTKKAPKKRSSWLTVLLFLLLLASVVAFAWSYTNYQKAQQQLAQFSTFEGQQQLAKDQIKQLVDEVSKLIILPTDEDPTVATVLDAAALAKDQPFYKDAKNGDKVIIYVKAKKAIVYDPVLQKLVNVGPIYINENAQTESTAPAAPVDNTPVNQPVEPVTPVNP